MDGHEEKEWASLPPIIRSLMYVKRGNYLLFYDSLISHFSFSAFFESFLYEVLNPLLIPYFFVKFGNFVLFSSFVYPVLSPSTVITYYTTVGNWFFVAVLYGVGNVRLEIRKGLVVPLLAMVLHKLFVALKYASFSPSEYRRIRRGADAYKYRNADVDVTNMSKAAKMLQEHTQLALFFSCFITSGTLWFELFAASVFLKLDLSQLYFSINAKNLDNVRRWRHLLLEAFSKEQVNELLIESEDKKVFSVDALSVAVAISYKLSSPSLYWLSATFGLMFAILPFVSNKNIIHSANMLECVVIAYSVGFAFIFYTAILNFFCIALTDQFRRYEMATMLGAMIKDAKMPHFTNLRLGNKTYTEGTYDTSCNAFKEMLRLMHPADCICTTKKMSKLSDCQQYDQDTLQMMCEELSERKSILCENENERDDNTPFIPMPTIDDSSSNNQVVWKALRRVFQGHSHRFRFRVDTYIGGTTIIAVLLLSILTLSVISAVLKKKSRDEFLSNLLNQQLIVGISVFVAAVVLFIVIGAQVNSRMSFHRAYVNDMQLRVAYMDAALSNMRSTMHVKYEGNLRKEHTEILRILSETNTVNNVEVDDKTYPVKIVGMTCTTNLAVSILSSVVFIFSALWNIFE